MSVNFAYDKKCHQIEFKGAPSEIRPASEVTILGKLLGRPQEWKVVDDGEEIILEKAP